MNIEVNESLNEQILALTQEMLNSAQENNWVKMAELEQTRLALFKDVFSHGIAGNEKLARELLLADERMMDLVKAGMPVVQQELLAMRSSGKANTAYQTIQSFEVSDNGSK